MNDLARRDRLHAQLVRQHPGAKRIDVWFDLEGRLRSKVTYA